MSSRSLYYLGAGIGSTLGGFVPMLWGGGAFSGWAMLTSTVGGVVGIWVMYRLVQGA